MSDGSAPGMASRTGGEQAGHRLLSLALSAMMADVEALAGAVYLLAPDEPVLELAVMAGMPRVFAAPWERVAVSAPIPVADAVRERQIVWVGSEEEMAHRYPRVALVLPYPFTLAALPVATGDTTYGAVFVTWPGSHAPHLSDRERDYLTAACDRLAQRLERAAAAGRPLRREADEAVGASASGLSSAVQAVRMVSRMPEGICALDLNGRVTFANDGAAQLLGTPIRALLGNQLWVVLPWLNDPAYEDRYRAALISQRPTSFVAARPDGDRLSFRLYPSASGLTASITPAPGVSGAPARPAGVPGGQVATSLVAISHILSLASALTEAVGVQDVVELVADEIMPAVGSRALVVLAAEMGRLRVLGHRGYDDPRVVERFDGTPLSEDLPGTQALSTGIPAFFESRQELEDRYPARRETADGMAAWAYLPLIASGRPVGTCVLGYAEPHHFSTDDRTVLTSLGGLIAQALERARLYDAKHRLAQGLQAALLPRTLPSPAGLESAARYLPCTEGMEIGGDFYDLIRVGDDVSAVIGDVQGHNVTAAALMGQVRTAVRAYATVGQWPGHLMESTNRLLVDLDAGLFASCIYLRLDPARQRALVARAGHPPPLLLEPGGRVRTLQLPGGPVLGIDADADYPTSEIRMPPGTLLVLYTDGLVESPETDLDDALADLAKRLAEVGDQPLEALADELLTHAGKKRRRADDIALLLLRPTAQPPPASGSSHPPAL